jgi:hypothetical protein
MPTSSIVFSPEIDERQLDREADSVNESLDDAASDIQTDIQAEIDADAPGGVGGGFERDGGMGGVGGAGAAGALASKIPKPIAGVATSVAMPVALTGGVGLGLLSAMHGASARLQTSTQILGQAWNNIWRPWGDNLDKMFVRPVAQDILAATEQYGEHLRNAFGGGDIRTFFAEWLRGSADMIAPVIGEQTERGFEGVARIIEGTFEWGELIPEFGTWEGVGDIPRFGSWEGIGDIPRFGTWGDMGNIPNFPGWAEVGNIPKWPGWGQYVDHVDLADFATPTNLANHVRPVRLGDWVNPVNLYDFVTGINIGNFIEIPDILSNGSDPGGRTPDPGGDDPTGGNNGGEEDPPRVPDPREGIPVYQGGGVVGRTGLAMLHEGERVVTADKVGEGGEIEADSSGVDMSGVERRLDDLIRNVKRLQQMTSQSIEVDGETLGRTVTNARRNKVSDMDPTS